MAKSTQIMDYDAVESEKQSISSEMDKMIEKLTSINAKFLSISDQNIWTGNKSETFFEDLNKFWTAGVNGEGIISAIEKDKTNMVNFIDAAILQTAAADAMSADGVLQSTASFVLTKVLGVDSDKAKKIVSGAAAKPDISGYKENSEKGFVLTTDNKKYDITDEERYLFYAIVAAEAAPNKDDALGVASVILNRCEDSAWQRGYGDTITAQVTRPGQFEVYSKGYYKKYLNGQVEDYVKEACDAALNGARNNDYLSFRSSGTTSYSDNQITQNGNRYK